MGIFQTRIPDSLCKYRQWKWVCYPDSRSSFQCYIGKGKTGISISYRISFIRNESYGCIQTYRLHAERIVQFTIGRIVLRAFLILIGTGKHSVPSYGQGKLLARQRIGQTSFKEMCRLMTFEVEILTGTLSRPPKACHRQWQTGLAECVSCRQVYLFVCPAFGRFITIEVCGTPGSQREASDAETQCRLEAGSWRKNLLNHLAQWIPVPLHRLSRKYMQQQWLLLQKTFFLLVS